MFLSHSGNFLPTGLKPNGRYRALRCRIIATRNSNFCPRAKIICQGKSKPATEKCLEQPIVTSERLKHAVCDLGLSLTESAIAAHALEIWAAHRRFRLALLETRARQMPLLAKMGLI